MSITLKSKDVKDKVLEKFYDNIYVEEEIEIVDQNTGDHTTISAIKSDFHIEPLLDKTYLMHGVPDALAKKISTYIKTLK